MSFDSKYQVVISAPVSRVYDTFSSLDVFERFIHLSPTCHSVEVLRTDQVILQAPGELAQRSLGELAKNRPTFEPHEPAQGADQQQLCTRIHFKMIERIPLLFGLVKHDVTIFGTQTTIQSLKLHIYESDANKGLVKIYKLRRFLAGEQQECVVHELIMGETNRVLRQYTQSSCRDAHQRHMQSYQTLLK